MLYSFTRMATVGVKGLKLIQIRYSKFHLVIILRDLELP